MQPSVQSPVYVETMGTIEAKQECLLSYCDTRDELPLANQEDKENVNAN